MKRFPFFPQLSSNECGPACLKMILAFYGKQYSLKTLTKICDPDHLGISVKTLSEAADQAGLRSKALLLELKDVHRMPLPAILFWKQSHFVVLYKINSAKRTYSIADPQFGKMEIDETLFMENWIGTRSLKETKGIVLLLEKGTDFETIKLIEKPFASYQRLYDFTVKTILAHKRKYTFTFFVMLTALLLNWAAPVIFQKIIDKGIGSHNISLVKLLIAGQAICAVGYVLFITFYEYLVLKINFSVSTNLLRGFLIDITKLPLIFFLRRISSELLQRINDLELLQRFITRHSIKFLITGANFVVFLSLLFVYKVEIGGIYLLSTLLIILWSCLFLKRRALIDYTRFNTSSEYKNSYFELVAGMPDIQINNASENRTRKLIELLRRTNALLLKTLHVENYQVLGTEVIGGIRNITVIGLCALWVINEKMSLGEMLGINYILGQLNGVINFFSNFLRDYQDAQLALNRTEEVTSEVQPEESACTEEIKFRNKISFKNVRFKYSKSQDRYIFDNLNFEIPKGKITAIVGNSGSGKTTVVKLLLGFYPVKEGSIFIDDMNLGNLPITKWREKCGTVLQDGYIFRGSIIENIALHEEKPDFERVRRAAEIACIDNYINSLPMEYYSLIGKGGILLSGGEKQRLLIARAVYKNPEILIMDEATNSLDANNEKEISDNLSRFFHNRTVVVVAHRLNTIRQADQVIVLNNGRIVEKGTHSELMSNSRQYSSLFKNQMA